MEREKLEREIHQLTQIIGANAFAWFPSPRPARTGPGCKSRYRYAAPSGQACGNS